MEGKIKCRQVFRASVFQNSIRYVMAQEKHLKKETVCKYEMSKQDSLMGRSGAVFTKSPLFSLGSFFKGR